MESLICVYNATPPVPPASRETHWDCENESFQMLNKLPRIQTEPGPHHLVKTHSLGELQVNCSVPVRPGRPKYKLLQFYTERNLRNVGPGANSVNNRDYTLTAETETASPTPFTSLLLSSGETGPRLTPEKASQSTLNFSYFQWSKLKRENVAASDLW